VLKFDVEGTKQGVKF